jgi:hypothetical protein
MTSPVAPWRLQLLRAFYLLIAVGTAFNFGPSLLSHSAEWAARQGITAAMLTALALLCLAGLRHPLKLLPLLLWELLWKLIWLLLFGLPAWWAGATTPGLAENLVACLLGVVLTPLVLPWDYLWQQWRGSPATQARVS